MSIVVNHHTQNVFVSSNTPTTDAITIPSSVGSTIIVVVSTNNGMVSVPTDNQGNIYHSVESLSSVLNIFRAYGATTGVTTITLSPGNTVIPPVGCCCGYTEYGPITVDIYDVSGLTTSDPLDQSAYATFTTGLSPTVVTPTTGTTAQANELVIGLFNEARTTTAIAPYAGTQQSDNGVIGLAEYRIDAGGPTTYQASGAIFQGQNTVFADASLLTLKGASSVPTIVQHSWLSYSGNHPATLTLGSPITAGNSVVVFVWAGSTGGFGPPTDNTSGGSNTYHAANAPFAYRNTWEFGSWVAYNVSGGGTTISMVVGEACCGGACCVPGYDTVMLVMEVTGTTASNPVDLFPTMVSHNGITGSNYSISGTTTAANELVLGVAQGSGYLSGAASGWTVVSGGVSPPGAGGPVFVIFGSAVTAGTTSPTWTTATVTTNALPYTAMIATFKGIPLPIIKTGSTLGTMGVG